MWGMPIGELGLMFASGVPLTDLCTGEFFDVEKLSDVCAETGRYTFFFTSWPLNM
jgi:hypothetical protein